MFHCEWREKQIDPVTGETYEARCGIVFVSGKLVNSDKLWVSFYDINGAPSPNRFTADPHDLIPTEKRGHHTVNEAFRLSDMDYLE